MFIVKILFYNEVLNKEKTFICPVLISGKSGSQRLDIDVTKNGEGVVLSATLVEREIG